MDRWEKPLRENPSFSSTLLDAIYRSIDEPNGKGEEEMIFYRETIRKKHGSNSKEGMQRACMIENWMEKKVSYEKVAVRRKSVADFNGNHSVLLNSSSSSSDSSSGGGFSSSESESVYGLSSRSSSYTMNRPKPIRTSISSRPDQARETDMYRHHHERNYAPMQKPKHEQGSFIKTKSKALKIYGDLKKVKQPISPGGKLASFLNSIFTAGNTKKAKISSNFEDRKLKSDQTSTCSSASSFSRSCLSKTSPSGGKLSNNGAKRSVRFYPVSVIVDEESRPCGHKSLYGADESLMTITAPRNPIMSENCRVEEVAREFLRNYQKKKEDLDMKDLPNVSSEDEDDAASCASSDLFELDNLSAIGIERYREELPVYETTNLDTNRAIANGIIV